VYVTNTYLEMIGILVVDYLSLNCISQRELKHIVFQDSINLISNM